MILQNSTEFIEERKYIQAIDILIDLLYQIKSYQQKLIFAKDSDTFLENEEELNPEECYVRAYELIGCCLQKFENIDAYSEAKKVYQKINFIDQACLCFEKMISLENEREEKFICTKEYIEYLKSKFRIERLIQWQQKLIQIAYNRKTRSEAVTKYEGLQNDWVVLLENSSSYWQKLSHVTFNEDLITSIRNLVKNLTKKQQT